MVEYFLKGLKDARILSHIINVGMVRKSLSKGMCAIITFDIHFPQKCFDDSMGTFNRDMAISLPAFEKPIFSVII